MVSRHKLSTILFLYLMLFSFNSFSQNLDGLYTLLPENTKQIDKALGEITEAGKLTKEANNYYNEASELQSNFELDEKTLQKKLSATEDKAISLQLKADKLYSGAYQSLNKLCQEELKSSGQSTVESEQYVRSANDMMNQAAEKRKGASDTKNAYEKASFLNDAAGLESTAIENLMYALQIQKGITPQFVQQEEPEVDYVPPVKEESYTSQQYYEDTYYTQPVVQKSENLSVNQSVINKYQDYVNDPTIPDPITVNRSGVSGVSDVSMDNARDRFFSMHQGTMELYQPAYGTGMDEQQAIADSLTAVAQITAEESGYTPDETYKEELTAATIPTEESSYSQKEKEKKPETKKEKKPVAARESVDISYVQQSTGVRFMVQIAASRAPLTRAQLWAIYPGNQSIEVVQENGWYKYRIGHFRTFSDAERVAMESGVKSAWVLSTNEDRPVSLVEAREMTRVLESDVRRYGSKAIKDGVDFYVQLAASRMRMTENQRSSICSSPDACREIIENGWFKYQIYAGTDYQQAVDLKNKLAGNSFIVAYEKGAKLKLYNAINKK